MNRSCLWSSSLARSVGIAWSATPGSRALKTALVVGTVLGVINRGSALLTGQFTAQHVVPLLITYLVPFTVATYGQMRGKTATRSGENRGIGTGRTAHPDPPREKTGAPRPPP